MGFTKKAGARPFLAVQSKQFDPHRISEMLDHVENCLKIIDHSARPVGMQDIEILTLHVRIK